MSTFLLGLALLGITDDASRQIERNFLLGACAEEVVPYRAWCQDVVLEVQKQKVAGEGCELIAYLTGPYYQEEVAGKVRRHLINDWDEDKMLYLATRGKHGLRPDPWERFWLMALVRKIGLGLPGLVARGVPVKE